MEIKDLYQVNDNGDVVYVEIFEVPEQDQKTLYRRAEEFITHTYVDAESVIDSRSMEEGYLICKGILSVPMQILGTPQIVPIKHTLKLEMKDGKSRMIVTIPGQAEGYPFVQRGKRKLNMVDRAYAKNFIGGYDAVVDLANRYHQALKEGSTGVADDW